MFGLGPPGALYKLLMDRESTFGLKGRDEIFLMSSMLSKEDLLPAFTPDNLLSQKDLDITLFGGFL